jgi:hypothetical protein
MEMGSEKMIYQWNSDLNIITRQTEESKRVGEILKGLKLGCVSSLLMTVHLLGLNRYHDRQN